jgi:hypothetical protein
MRAERAWLHTHSPEGSILSNSSIASARSDSRTKTCTPRTTPSVGVVDPRSSDCTKASIPSLLNLALTRFASVIEK